MCVFVCVYGNPHLQAVSTLFSVTWAKDSDHIIKMQLVCVYKMRMVLIFTAVMLVTLLRNASGTHKRGEARVSEARRQLSIADYLQILKLIFNNLFLSLITGFYFFSLNIVTFIKTFFENIHIK